MRDGILMNRGQLATWSELLINCCRCSYYHLVFVPFLSHYLQDILHVLSLTPNVNYIVNKISFSHLLMNEIRIKTHLLVIFQKLVTNGLAHLVHNKQK